jgi:hypothetical protein
MSIVNDKMSDTPETDARTYVPSIGASTVPANFSRKLERERDEAITRRMETIMQCELYEQERDEALEKIKQQKLEIVRLNGATNHAGGTPLKIALRERNEARQALEYIAHSGLSARHIEDYAKEFLSKK